MFKEVSEGMGIGRSKYEKAAKDMQEERETVSVSEKKRDGNRERVREGDWREIG